LYIIGLSPNSEAKEDIKLNSTFYRESSSVVEAFGAMREQKFTHVFVEDQPTDMSLEKATTLLAKLNSESKIEVVSAGIGLNVQADSLFNKDPKPTESISLKQIQELSRGDGDFVNAMIDTYRQEMPHYIAELERYIESKNSSGIAAMAHKLKAPLNMLSITSCDKEIAELDELNFNPDYVIEEAKIFSFGQKVLDISKGVLQQLSTYEY
jgi:HPt (histidine-containing phosphotransfer) domain-containing protein